MQRCMYLKRNDKMVGNNYHGFAHQGIGIVIGNWKILGLLSHAGAEN